MLGAVTPGGTGVSWARGAGVGIGGGAVMTGVGFGPAFGSAVVSAGGKVPISSVTIMAAGCGVGIGVGALVDTASGCVWPPIFKPQPGRLASSERARKAAPHLMVNQLACDASHIALTERLRSCCCCAACVARSSTVSVRPAARFFTWQ